MDRRAFVGVLGSLASLATGRASAADAAPDDGDSLFTLIPLPKHKKDGGTIAYKAPVETTVDIVDGANLDADYATRIRRLLQANPKLDMSDRNLLLVLERPALGKGGMRMDECRCQCGEAYSCGGGGGGGGSLRAQ